MHSTAWKTTLRSEGHRPRCRPKTPTTSGTTTSPTSPQHPAKPPDSDNRQAVRPAIHPAARNPSGTATPDSNPAQSTVFEPAVSHHTAPRRLRHSNSRHPSGTQHRLRTGNHTPPHLLQQPAYRPVASDPAAARTMRQPP